MALTVRVLHARVADHHSVACSEQEGRQQCRVKRQPLKNQPAKSTPLHSKRQRELGQSHKHTAGGHGRKRRQRDTSVSVWVAVPRHDLIRIGELRVEDEAKAPAMPDAELKQAAADRAGWTTGSLDSNKNKRMTGQPDELRQRDCTAQRRPAHHGTAAANSRCARRSRTGRQRRPCFPTCRPRRSPCARCSPCS